MGWVIFVAGAVLSWGAYGALLFAIAHWLLLAWSWIPAVLHLVLLIAAWGIRILARRLPLIFPWRTT